MDGDDDLRKAQQAWPKGVRELSIGETVHLGVDANGDLCWRGKPVEIRRPLDLTRLQTAIAMSVAVFTFVGALGTVVQALAAYNELACKISWPAVCPSKETTMNETAVIRIMSPSNR